MLKLVQYDFRRSRDLTLSFFVIAILLHAGIWLSSSTMGMELISLHLIAYVFLGLGVVYICANTYARNIKWYHRRLLPVQPIKTVLSPLLLCLLLILAIVVTVLLHLWIYILIYSADFLPENFWGVALVNMPQVIWAALFSMITVMFSITTAGCFRIKGKLWIGIAVFIVLQNILSYLEQLMFGNYFAGLQGAFRFKVESSAERANGVTLSYIGVNYWPIAFEVVVAVILVLLMSQLVKTKIKE